MGIISRIFRRIVRIRYCDINDLLLPDSWFYNDAISVERLRRRLRLTERIIKHIAGENEKTDRLYKLGRKQLESLDNLLRTREYFLNRMFSLGASDEEIEGFKRVNDTLKKLNDSMYERTRELWRRELGFEVKTEFDDDIDIEAAIKYSYNWEDSVLQYANDSWYGSDFRRMIEIKDYLMYKGWSEVKHIHTSRRENSIPGMSDKELNLEDWADKGTSWAGSLVWQTQNPRLKDVFIHYPMHDLFDHKNIPLPDIVRLNDFWCDIRLHHQHIVDQYGNHESLIRNNFHIFAKE